MGLAKAIIASVVVLYLLVIVLIGLAIYMIVKGRTAEADIAVLTASNTKLVASNTTLVASNTALSNLISTNSTGQLLLNTNVPPATNGLVFKTISGSGMASDYLKSAPSNTVLIGGPDNSNPTNFYTYWKGSDGTVYYTIIGGKVL